MKYCPDAPSTHYRLSEDTWALVVEDYMNGASAKEAAAKWKTTAGSVYRHARLTGKGKRAAGDARARAHARLIEEEEAAYRGLSPVGSRALKGLFAPARAREGEGGDPAALAQAATLASGRAMKGRLWAEAKALAGLAESYQRMAERTRNPPLAIADFDVETAPLETVQRVVGSRERLDQLFHIDPLEHDDPLAAVKREYWMTREEQLADIHAMLDRVAETAARAQAMHAGAVTGFGSGPPDPDLSPPRPRP